MREPNINHSNIENPLDIYDKDSINKFRCFFNTREITSYRRYLKLINYTTYGGYTSEDNVIDELYLDDYEDSRKINKKENDTDENFLGSYRILLSKKIDIYERKFDDLLTLGSKTLAYNGLIMMVFTILIKILVNPNDSIRIYEALKEKNSSFTDPQRIFKSFKETKTINEHEFEEKLKRNCCEKLFDKFVFIFCHCCNKNKSTEYLYIIKDYIDNNLYIENHLVNSVQLNKNKGEAQNRSGELQVINNGIMNISSSSSENLIKENLIYWSLFIILIYYLDKLLIRFYYLNKRLKNKI